MRRRRGTVGWRKATREASDAIRELEKWQARPCAACGLLGLLSEMLAVEHDEGLSPPATRLFLVWTDVPKAWAHKRCMAGSKYERRGEADDAGSGGGADSGP